MRGRKVAALLLTGVMAAASVVCVWPQAASEIHAADSIVCDGDASDWNAIAAQSSSDANVNSWKVAVSDDYVYLYVEQAATEGYGEAIGNTPISLTYDSEYFNGKYSTLYVKQNWDAGGVYIIKDAWDYVADGASLVFEGGNTDYNVNSAFAEIAIPRAWFPSENFTLTYAGTSVASANITTIDGATALGATPAEEENSGYGDGNSNAVDPEDADDADGAEDTDTTTPTYSGIIIDGSFSDWETVTKTQNPADAVLEGAAVWDGDYVYLYLREQTWYQGCIGQAGPYHNGNFCIELSDGTKTSILLNGRECYMSANGQRTSLDWKYAKGQYEIAVPVASLQGYNSKISYVNFGVMTNGTPLYISEGVANRKNPIDYDDTTAGKLAEITYDHDFTDWEGYQKTNIQYSTAGKDGADAVGALYSDGDLLFGYVDYYGAYYTDAFNWIYLTINGNYKTTYYGDNDCMKFTLRGVDANGNVQQWNQAVNLQPGEYEYYIFDTAYVGSATNINNPWTFCYGKAYIKVDATGHMQMEYYIDIPTLVKVVNIDYAHWGAYNWHIDQSDIKTFHVQYPRIGQQWVSCGGTSTGAIFGILLCIGVVVAAQLIQRRRKNHTAVTAA